MSRSHLLSIVLCLLLASPAFATVAERIDKHTFDVLLDGVRIGEHRFVVRDTADERRVRSEARFDVRLFFVPVYAYRHSNTESWKGGCLNRIESETDSNGTPYRVIGDDRGNTFAVSTQAGSRVYEDSCIMTFAYWDRQMLDRERLLNAQTGELVAVEIDPIGRLRLELINGTIEVDAFRITSPERADLDISTFYDPNTGRWLGLESRLDNGRIMQYRPTPDSGLLAAGRPSAGAGTGGEGL